MPWRRIERVLFYAPFYACRYEQPTATTYASLSTRHTPTWRQEHSNRGDNMCFGSGVGRRGSLRMACRMVRQIHIKRQHHQLPDLPDKCVTTRRRSFPEEERTGRTSPTCGIRHDT